MAKISNGYYRSGDRLIHVRGGRVVMMEEITKRCPGSFTVALDPREWNEYGSDEEIEEYLQEIKQATSQLRNPFTELERLGTTYDEAYALLSDEPEMVE